MKVKSLRWLSLLLPLLWTLPLQASESTLRAALQQCLQQQNATERLHCYDQLATASSTEAVGRQRATEQGTERQAAAAAERRSERQPEPPAVAEAAEAGFGKTAQRPTEQLDRIYATVTKVDKDARQHLVVHFDNGQVWRQSSAEYYPIEVGQTHYIRRAMLGSFVLSNDNSNRSTRVRRIE
ncbi:hypothetical protein [Alkalimonas amylolytica]|uniref:Uncharacterized protein n=1 Tax=Alkalimonas amylolytica TaxID=152573 RepID=A0A1H4ELG1_ALKAM|nr:hypothetical protein [Alkalimonas amylolytica]SEA85727.1 hypothetical protein SAMN04488051_107112 [Alkalimonas amylolytica]